MPSTRRRIQHSPDGGTQREKGKCSDLFFLYCTSFFQSVAPRNFCRFKMNERVFVLFFSFLSSAIQSKVTGCGAGGEEVRRSSEEVHSAECREKWHLRCHKGNKKLTVMKLDIMPVRIQQLRCGEKPPLCYHPGERLDAVGLKAAFASADIVERTDDSINEQESSRFYSSRWEAAHEAVACLRRGWNCSLADLTLIWCPRQVRCTPHAANSPKVDASELEIGPRSAWHFKLRRSSYLTLLMLVYRRLSIAALATYATAEQEGNLKKKKMFENVV